jgi:hypothetical protein
MNCPLCGLPYILDWIPGSGITKSKEYAISTALCINKLPSKSVILIYIGTIKLYLASIQYYNFSVFANLTAR